MTVKFIDKCLCFCPYTFGTDCGKGFLAVVHGYRWRDSSSVQLTRRIMTAVVLLWGIGINWQHDHPIEQLMVSFLLLIWKKEHLFQCCFHYVSSSRFWLVNKVVGGQWLGKGLKKEQESGELPCQERRRGHTWEMPDREHSHYEGAGDAGLGLKQSRWNKGFSK